MAGLQGRVIAGYQLIAPLGGGGIAEVYRAQPMQPGGREAVVKIIHPEFAREPGFQARFGRVVQMAGKLGDHPHILPLLASGEENGFLYLVTPYVPEGTLRDWMGRGGRLGATDVGPFFRQLCNGLAYAHSLGVVHGNLKPANIFLFQGRHVLIGDFGLLWDITQLDMKHAGSGTEAVEHLAPEAFSGHFSQQGDIYAVGALLFTTLTGRAPYRGASPADIYAGHAQLPIPMLAQALPSLPPTLQMLDPVIARAMAKRPEERFPSVALAGQAIETTLRQAAASMPLPGNPPSVAAPLSQFPGGFGMTGGPSQFGGPGGPQGGFGAPMGYPGAPANPAGAAPGQFGFAPLPSTEDAGGLMDQGHIAANWNDASAQQTVRVPAPMPTPGPPFDGGMAGYGPPMGPPAGMMPGMTPGMPTGMPAGMTPGMPAGMPTGMPAGMQTGMPDFGGMGGMGDIGGMPGAMPPRGYTNPPMMDAPLPPPMPPDAHQGPLPPETPRDQKGYSALELGLPRLTTMDMGGQLSAGLDQQLMDEVAGAAAPPAGSSVALKAVDGDEGWEESRAYAGAARGGWDDGDSRMSAAYSAQQSAAYSVVRPAPRSGRSRRGYDDERDERRSGSRRERDGGRDGGRERESRSRSRRDRYDEMEIEARRGGGGRASGGRSSGRRSGRPDTYRDEAGYGRRPSRSRRDEYEAYDAAEGGGARWLRPTLLTLIPVVLLALLGVAVLAPQVCPISACKAANAAVGRIIPGLGKGGGDAAAAAPLTASPAQVQMSTNVGRPVSAQIKLTAVAAVTWQAGTDVAWVTVTPASGSLNAGDSATLTLQALPVNVDAKTYTSTLVVSAAGPTVRVPLTINVAPVTLSVTPPNLSFATCDTPKTLTVKNIGSSQAAVTAAASDASQAAIVKISPASLTLDPGASGTLRVSLACTAQAGGTYTLALSTGSISIQVPTTYKA